MGKCSKRRPMNASWVSGTGRNMYTIGVSVGKGQYGREGCCDEEKNIENIKRIQENFVTPFANKNYHLIGNPFTAIELLENDRKYDCTGGVLTDFMQNTVSAADFASTLDFYYNTCKQDYADQECLINDLYNKIQKLNDESKTENGHTQKTKIKAHAFTKTFAFLSFIANINLPMALYHIHYYSGFCKEAVYDPKKVTYINKLLNRIGYKAGVKMVQDRESC